MNITKAEVKMLTAHEIGCRLDDTLSSVGKEVSQWEGANLALVQAGKTIEDLALHVDKDLEEGSFDLEAAKFIKKYITRAAGVVASLAQQASNRNLMARGKVEAMEHAILLVKGIHDGEQKKVDAFKAAFASGAVKLEDDGTQVATVPGLNLPGIRPGMSIKEQRQAEDAAEAAATKAAEETDEAPPTPVKKKSGKWGKSASNP